MRTLTVSDYKSNFNVNFKFTFLKSFIAGDVFRVLTDDGIELYCFDPFVLEVLPFRMFFRSLSDACSFAESYKHMHNARFWRTKYERTFPRFYERYVYLLAKESEFLSIH